MTLPLHAADSAAVDLSALVARTPSPMTEVITRYTADRRAMLRRHDVRGSADQREAMGAFFASWEAGVEAIDFDALDQEGRIDWLLLRNRILYEQQRLRREKKIWDEVGAMVPFADVITELQVTRRNFEDVDPAGAATALHELKTVIKETQEAVRRGDEALEKRENAEAEVKKAAAPKTRKAKSVPSPASEGEEAEEKPSIEATKTMAHRAAQLSSSLKRSLDDWFTYYDGYHPSFSWWVRDPHAQVVEALDGYIKFLRSEIVGQKEGEDGVIVGDPIGREGLMEDLALEMIPYTPEELIAIAEQQFEWCDREMLRASRDMGFGDDWHKAMEKVKTLHVEPGEQPNLIHMLAEEAVDFLEARDLLTIPPLAKEVWRMEMMSPEWQKITPFFTGGEVINVSFPTDGMAHDEKWMSLRGNNIHFSRATVHHELIPGHHLQGFMTQRYHPHRRAFSTPFWGEGWALYWEMLLWDKEFQSTPEDRVGALFWRMHRCARIIFSLKFHLGQMTPDEAIAFLIDRVGHEPENAEAEVRRSFEGSYSPLYQAAYMLGGLQIRALHEQLVGSGEMTNRDFHDAILQGGRMPIEMVRARLMDIELTRDYKANWMFAGEDLVVESGD
jgi:PAS domain-containing protein